MSTENTKKLNIAICHPDLGIGGAERLIIDAALELSSRGHSVQIFTNHHDINRCFPETIDGTIPVKVYGDFIPRHLFCRFHALFAYLRFLFLAICILFWKEKFDLIFADQISAAIPIFRIKSKVLFYCHFPDLLLAKHTNIFQKLYRMPIDWLEETTTGMSNLTLVNSEFTLQTFSKTFPKISKFTKLPQILYPAVDLKTFLKKERTISGKNDDNINDDINDNDYNDDNNRRRNGKEKDVANGMKKEIENEERNEKVKNDDVFMNDDDDDDDDISCLRKSLPQIPHNAPFFLSINRFERKKNLELAIYAFSILKKRQKRAIDEVDFSILSSSASVASSDSDDLCLIMAGGYDIRLSENREYLNELKILAQNLELENFVFFLPSFNDQQKKILLSKCICVLYTPEYEHFGIVPLEAMASSKAVIACNNGGPTETIVPNYCGFLCESTPQNFASAMETLLRNPNLAIGMGIEARKRVEETFSRDRFGERLEKIVHDLVLGDEF